MVNISKIKLDRCTCKIFAVQLHRIMVTVRFIICAKKTQDKQVLNQTSNDFWLLEDNIINEFILYAYCQTLSADSVVHDYKYSQIQIYSYNITNN